MYVVIDLRTDKQVAGPYKRRSLARNKADALDSAYGAYRYTVECTDPATDEFPTTADRNVYIPEEPRD